jgi:hypothetical protein
LGYSKVQFETLAWLFCRLFTECVCSKGRQIASPSHVTMQVKAAEGETAKANARAADSEKRLRAAEAETEATKRAMAAVLYLPPLI